MVMRAEPLAQAGQCSDELITVDTSSALQKTLHVSRIVVKSGDSKEVEIQTNILYIGLSILLMNYICLTSL